MHLSVSTYARSSGVQLLSNPGGAPYYVQRLDAYCYHEFKKGTPECTFLQNCFWDKKSSLIVQIQLLLIKGQGCGVVQSDMLSLENVYFIDSLNAPLFLLKTM